MGDGDLRSETEGIKRRCIWEISKSESREYSDWIGEERKRCRMIKHRDSEAIQIDREPKRNRFSLAKF